jgi:sirohydrochlorin ferrochelatase
MVAQPSRSNVTQPLSELGSEQRWQQLQQLRRGLQAPDAWLQALLDGALEAEPDLLAALIPVISAPWLERLLASALGRDPDIWLQAALPEWPTLCAQVRFRDVWLEPLLQHTARAESLQQLSWLQLLGVFREPRVALLLRAAVGAHGTTEAGAALLPLLGRQRQPGDSTRLMKLALDPGPTRQRQQALEGLALGLSAWPQRPLAAGLKALAGDLDPALAAKAVDLLARLPAGASALRQCLSQALEPAVQARLQRRLRCSPMVLVVHGRQGGVIPCELQQLAAVLAERRGAPVLLQPLTAPELMVDAEFWLAARKAGALSLVPLLLLPGGHVRHDLPPMAFHWQAAARREGVELWRRPFLGSWPCWQAALAEELNLRRAAEQRQALWLHHPLEGELAGRYVRHLSSILGCAARSAAYGDPSEALQQLPSPRTLLLPLTLATNRLSESLEKALPPTSMAPDQPKQLPPLMHWPALHRFLKDALTQLP